MMSSLNYTIKWETRLCEVDGRYGYFHTWEHYSEIVPPSLLKGGHSGGVISGCLAIVEFKDGVERIEPTKLKFIDAIHDEILDVNLYFNGSEEKNNG